MSRLFAVLVLGVSVGVGVSVQAQEGPPGGPTSRPARGPRGGGGGGAPMNLGGAMRDMGKNLESLKANATDPDKMEDSIHSVETMERDAAVAKLNLPPMVQHLSGDEKTAKTTDYRADITELQKTLLSLEDAIAAKNADDIKKGLDSLEAIMNKGHSEFIPKKPGE